MNKRTTNLVEFGPATINKQTTGRLTVNLPVCSKQPAVETPDTEAAQGPGSPIPGHASSLNSRSTSLKTRSDSSSHHQQVVDRCHHQKPPPLNLLILDCLSTTRALPSLYTVARLFGVS